MSRPIFWIISTIFALLVIPIAVQLAPTLYERYVPNEPITFEIQGPIAAGRIKAFAVTIRNNGAKPENSVRVFFTHKPSPTEIYSFQSKDTLKNTFPSDQTITFEKIYPNEEIRLNVSIEDKSPYSTDYLSTDIRVTTQESRAKEYKPLESLEIYKTTSHMIGGGIALIIAIAAFGSIFWKFIASDERKLELAEENLAHWTKVKARAEASINRKP